MRNDILWFLPRAEPVPETNDEKPGLFDIGDHDPVLRYSALGIFLILGTAALAIARPVALPVTAGIVFGIVLGPLTDRLIRKGLPAPGAAGLVVVVGGLVLIAIFGLLAAPVAMGVDQIPAILATLRTKLDGLFDIVHRVQGATGSGGPALEVSTGNQFSPLLNIALTSTSAAGGVLIFIATVYFYLAGRRTLKARLLRMCLGRGARQVADTFFQETESRIATYFGVVTVINLVVGLLATVLAWAAGFPYPPFWGAMAFVLNYLAFVGPFIATVLILGAGLTADTSLFGAIWPAAVFLGMHAIEGNIVTPSLIGRRLTMSPFLVFLSFVFWLWLWGPVGAVLSTPLLLIGLVMFEVLSSYRSMNEEEASGVPTAGTEASAARSMLRSGAEA
ncbi:MAG: AI-2E family transporter [Phreatobacter sp.]|uniref:AI-2E family transporter n=1 Tax=Phreatobacter sp. TaxID=1966341 RepID=UPI001A3BD207|nr:AI-2E family transporter [Phreatobacter sp.]MBL8568123.1 AI-2E family transporter [Phreatobacter sp.]